MGEYLNAMGLSNRELYDATGNMFDKDAILARAACPVSRWLSGTDLPSRQAVHPDTFVNIYTNIRTQVALSGYNAEHAPHPGDLGNLFQDITLWDRKAAAW
eukprot:16152009-Heterocapsa_arctica.AAC.1